MSSRGKEALFRTALMLGFWLHGSALKMSAACAFVDTRDVIYRLNGNAVQGKVETLLSGPCKDSWQPLLSGKVYKGTQEIQSEGEFQGSLGGNLARTMAAISLSQYGPGEYRVEGFHRLKCPIEICGYPQYSPPYEDNWDGYDEGYHTVQRPTISGAGSGGAMWYLGPGTAGQVQAQDGNYYYQEYQLTFNSNCNPSSACTETPQWTLTTEPGVPQQASLIGTTGQSVTIRSGAPNNPGNCQWSTTVKASIGGFESEGQEFAVNSPSHLVSQSQHNVTVPFFSGYESHVHWVVADTCSPAQAMVGLPLREAFGTFTTTPYVLSGWQTNPSAEWSTGFNYSIWEFYDKVGADNPSWSPAPVRLS